MIDDTRGFSRGRAFVVFAAVASCAAIRAGGIFPKRSGNGFLAPGRLPPVHAARCRAPSSRHPQLGRRLLARAVDRGRLMVRAGAGAAAWRWLVLVMRLSPKNLS